MLSATAALVAMSLRFTHECVVDPTGCRGTPGRSITVAISLAYAGVFGYQGNPEIEG
jgi:hypothetical protein